MKILSLGTDQEISLFRQAILQGAGHEVETRATEKEVLEVTEAVNGSGPPAHLDVVLVCHSLPAATARKAIRLLRQGHPEARIIYIARVYGEWPEVEADRYIVGTDGPLALLHVLTEVYPANTADTNPH